MTFKIVFVPKDDPQDTSRILYPTKDTVVFATIEKSLKLVAALQGAQGYVTGLLDTETGFVLVSRHQIARAMWAIFFRDNAPSFKYTYTLDETGLITLISGVATLYWDAHVGQYRVRMTEITGMGRANVANLATDLKALALLFEDIVHYQNQVESAVRVFDNG